MLDSIKGCEEFTEPEIARGFELLDDDEALWEEINTAVRSVVEKLIAEREAE